MADNSKIEWTDATWNPVTGCTVVSEGCRNCYAMDLAGTRLKSHPSRAGLTRQTADGRHVWTGEVRLNEQWLDQPLRWAKPRMVFVCAHGDLFHEAVPDEWIDRIFAVMALAPQHIFQVLTKRPERMRNYLSALRTLSGIADAVQPMRKDNHAVGPLPHLDGGKRWWPLANVWLGTSVEDQRTADERIPHLLAAPAAVRWLSAEPLLGPVNLGVLGVADQTHLNALRGERIEWGDPDDGILPPDITSTPRLDWVVVGGESGGNARPMHPDWARQLRDQCAAAGVPFFFKQWGAWGTDEGPGHDGTDYAMDGAQCAIFRNGQWLFHHNGFVAPLADEPEEWLFRLGKKAAGRLLDGVTHNAMPRLHGGEAAPRTTEAG